MADDQNLQVTMVSLASLAYTSATMRPSGETVADQQARILAGINRQLPDVAPAWRATWVGLTPDRANLAYVAHGATARGSAVAVGLRGTVLSAFDLIEDVDVLTTLPFSAGGATKGDVARGAMQAFTEVAMGTPLLAALADLGDVTDVYVTGHSLGGAMVTTVAPYLAQSLPGRVMLPYTFAAPTAGDAAFASTFDHQFPSAQCVVNQYDIAPCAWTDAGLTRLGGGFFPSADHTVSWGIWGLVKASRAVVGSLPPYQQPTSQAALNSKFSVRLFPGQLTEFEQWFAEAAFQHHPDTYLTLLGAAPLPATEPEVTTIDPATGPGTGGSSVTVTGGRFTSSSVVDFGVAASTGVTVNPGGTELTVVSPPGAGVVDVTVTTEFGTSATSASDRFTFTPA